MSLNSCIRIGNPFYMAPEVFKNIGAGTHASDMWSFGAIAYYILTGKHLVFGDIEIVWQRGNQNLTYPSLSAIFGPIDATNIPLLNMLSDLITRCLKANPKDRPSASQALIRLLPVIQACYEAQ